MQKGFRLLTLMQRWVAPALMALALGGCANLEAIKDFGNLSADSARYTALTDAYLASTEMSKRHTMRKDEAQRAKLTAQGQARQPHGVQLRLYHRGVSEYMAALAALAADEVVDYDGQLGPLIDTASSSGMIGAEQAGPVRAMSTLLADAVTNSYRQRELTRLIAAGNAPLQQVVADMVRIMAGFDSAIDDEAALYQAHYEELMHSASKTEPVAAELLWREHGATLAGFDQRKRAIASYIQTLKKISAAHQSLFDQRDRISDKEVLAQVKRYTREIRAAYTLVRAAGKSQQE